MDNERNIINANMRLSLFPESLYMRFEICDNDLEGDNKKVCAFDLPFDTWRGVAEDKEVV